MGATCKGGIRISGRASSAEKRITALTPSLVCVPLCKNGEESSILVQAGERVLVGQKLSDPASGTPAHASVSGEVTAIEPRRLASGDWAPCALIESDGEMAKDPSMTPCRRKLAEVPPEELREMIRSAGIMTSSFDAPLIDRIGEALGKKPEVIVVAFDDDPALHAAHAMLCAFAKEIVGGVKILLRASSARSAQFVVSDNDTKGRFFVREAIAGSTYLTVSSVEQKYPAAHPAVLVPTVGREDRYPLLVSAEEAFAVYRAFALGEPMISRILSVGGQAVKDPATALVPIGMPISDILSAVHLRRKPRLVLTGGVMHSGCAVIPEAPIEKSTAAILALSRSRIPAVSKLFGSCMGCDRCAAVCPMGLVPGALYRAVEEDDTAEEERLGLQNCISCGCCSFVCPGMAPVSERLAEAKRKRTDPSDEGKENPDETK